MASDSSGHRTTASRDFASRHLAAIVESSDDAIVSKDLDGIVISWNRAAERLFGYGAAEMIGQSIRRIIPPDRQGEEDRTLARIRSGKSVEHFETWRLRKDGTLVPISLTVSPILDDDGVVIGASKIARDITDRKQADTERAELLAMARDHAEVSERLNAVGGRVTAALDHDLIVQAVTDIATELTGAEFGAFFYDVSGADGQSYTLYTLAGAAREAFASFPHARPTQVVGPTFRCEGPVRLPDVTADPRYEQTPPFHGILAGEPPVRSYLAVPVKDHIGAVLGGLLFGHSRVGVFTESHERLVVGIALWATVALENARLYASAQDANRLKDQFLATLSHELRTPLNAIVGYVRMMRSGLLPNERIGAAYEVIDRNATSLTRIVDDILDVSRIIAGKVRLNVQTVDLAVVVRDAIETMGPAAAAKGIRIDVVVDPQAGPLSGDSERLQQAIWNLLSNAVKFTPRGGQVAVQLRRVESHVELVVSDTGVGIDAALLPHIFERFRQGDGATTREHGGLGLGLAIVRHLVELHGGTVHAASDGEGKGATFRVRLPVAAVLASQALPDQPALPWPGAGGNPLDLSAVRILAVDDDRDALALIKEVLTTAGADVRTAASAASALAQMEVWTPHVLVSDLGMPQMDGFELIKQIRAAESRQISQLPAAALSAYARSEDRVKALRSGFELHLTKPIDPLELVAAMATLARERRKDAQEAEHLQPPSTRS